MNSSRKIQELNMSSELNELWKKNPNLISLKGPVLRDPMFQTLASV